MSNELNFEKFQDMLSTSKDSERIIELTWKLLHEYIVKIKELEEEKEYLQLSLNNLANNMTYEGNTISYIYDKQKLYSKQLGIAGSIIRKHQLQEEFEQALKEEQKKG